MIDKGKILLTFFSVIFIFGLIWLWNSSNVSANLYMIPLKAISGMIIGMVLSLTSGFGLVLAIVINTEWFVLKIVNWYNWNKLD